MEVQPYYACEGLHLPWAGASVWPISVAKTPGRRGHRKTRPVGPCRPISSPPMFSDSSAMTFSPRPCVHAGRQAANGALTHGTSPSMVRLRAGRVRMIRLAVVTVHPQYVIPGRSTAEARFEIRKLRRHCRPLYSNGRYEGQGATTARGRSRPVERNNGGLARPGTE